MQHVRKPGIRSICAVLLLLAPLSPAAPREERKPDADRALLLRDVKRIAAPGVPGPIAVFGTHAFVVVAAPSGRHRLAPVAAAASWGRGRVVLFGHGGYFDPGALAFADTGRLMENAVRWAGGAAAGGNTSFAVGILGPERMRSFLERRGFSVTLLERLEEESFEPFRVLLLDPGRLAGDSARRAVADVVRAGKGVVAADLGWGWLQLHPGATLGRDHPGNRLFAPAGMAWADGTVNAPPEGIPVDAAAAAGPLLHARRALDFLAGEGSGKRDRGALSQAVETVLSATRALPPDEGDFLPRLQNVLHRKEPFPLPTAEHPLTWETPLARLALAVELSRLRNAPPEERKAHPAAALFPGTVEPGAPRVTGTIRVDPARPGWHGTGLYAPPGALITVTVPARAARLGLRVRIGAHTDSLWRLDRWSRCPEITRSEPIRSTTTRTASAFGGLLYVECPGRGQGEPVPVTVAGAVEAPRFVLDETAPEAWKDEIRNRPAPWAELETKKVVLTVPSRVVRSLENPTELLRFWNRVLDCAADLVARPRERERPERYVTDVQIGAGYMHSGYPIMTHLDMAEVVVNKECLVSNGHGGVWGLYHELGHNHQSPDWTFDGTVEVTCNLFTLYIFEKACAYPVERHAAFTPETRRKRVAAYLEAGARFEEWKGDPFLALIMYIQLEEAFGWDTFRELFAAYRRLTPAERPRTDGEKRDQWMERFSRNVGRNLAPFFQAWGIPVSKKARDAVDHLPVWMPEGFPPATEKGKGP